MALWSFCVHFVDFSHLFMVFMHFESIFTIIFACLNFLCIVFDPFLVLFVVVLCIFAIFLSVHYVYNYLVFY